MTMTERDKFFLSLIFFGNIILVLGFIYCISRSAIILESQPVFWSARFQFSPTRRVWFYWWWDRLFWDLYSLLRLDRLSMLRRSPSVAVDHIVTKRKVTGGHFASSGPGVSAADGNGLYYVYNNYGYEGYDEEIREVKTGTNGQLGPGWSWYQVSPTPTPSEGLIVSW